MMYAKFLDRKKGTTHNLEFNEVGTFSVEGGTYGFLKGVAEQFEWEILSVQKDQWVECLEEFRRREKLDKMLAERP